MQSAESLLSVWMAFIWSGRHDVLPRPLSLTLISVRQLFLNLIGLICEGFSFFATSKKVAL